LVSTDVKLVDPHHTITISEHHDVLAPVLLGAFGSDDVPGQVGATSEIARSEAKHVSDVDFIVSHASASSYIHSDLRNGNRLSQFQSVPGVRIRELNGSGVPVAVNSKIWALSLPDRHLRSELLVLDNVSAWGAT